MKDPLGESLSKMFAMVSGSHDHRPSQDLPERPKACCPHTGRWSGRVEKARPAVGATWVGLRLWIWPVDDGMLTMMMQPKFLVIPRAESRGSWSSGWGLVRSRAPVSACECVRRRLIQGRWLRQTKLQALCSSSADLLTRDPSYVRTPLGH